MTRIARVSRSRAALKAQLGTPAFKRRLERRLRALRKYRRGLRRQTQTDPSFLKVFFSR